MSRHASPDPVSTLRKLRHSAPLRFRRQQIALSALGHLYILALGAGALALTLGAVLSATEATFSVAALYAVLALLALAALGVCLRNEGEPGYGLPLSREEAPNLFVMLDKITRKLGAGITPRVRVTARFEISILRRPRFGPLGADRLILLVGLPVLQLLSRKEFAAMLARELATHVDRRARITTWLNAVLHRWKAIADTSRPGRRPPRAPGRVLESFPRWYAARLQAYATANRTRDTIDTDRRTSAIVGPQALADALIMYRLRERFLNERFWQGLWARAAHQAAPPFLPYSNMRTALTHSLTDEDAATWLAELMRTPAGNNGPALRDRILMLDARAEVPPTATRSAAQSLLGERLAALQKHFDAQWQQHTGKAWGLRFHAVSSAHDTVRRMGARDAATLTPEEAAHLGLAYETLGKPGEALALLLQAADNPNGSAVAALAVARLLQASDAHKAQRYRLIAHQRDPSLSAQSGEASPAPCGVPASYRADECCANA